MKWFITKVCLLLVLTGTGSCVWAAIPVGQNPTIEISAQVDIFLDKTKNVAIDTIAAPE